MRSCEWNAGDLLDCRDLLLNVDRGVRYDDESPDELLRVLRGVAKLDCAECVEREELADARGV